MEKSFESVVHGAVAKGSETIEEGVHKGSEFTVQAIAKGASKVKKLKEAPSWAKSLILTDWVSAACMAPIIAGLVVYIVYLWQAQQNFRDMLDIFNASGGLSRWITAYAIFLVVTLPLVTISLVYVFGLMLANFLSNTRVQRDRSAMSGVEIQPKRYKVLRWMLVALMALEYLGLLWLVAQLVATAILMVAAYAVEGAANSSVNFWNDVYSGYNDTALSKVANADIPEVVNKAYATPLVVNGTSTSVGAVVDAALVAAFNTSGAEALTRIQGTATNHTVCPDFCINLAFLKDMLSLDAIDSCICSPDQVMEVQSLASDSKGLLVAAIIGIILMIAFWVIMLMRLAANHDVMRVKYQLQGWLIASGYGEPSLSGDLPPAASEQAVSGVEGQEEPAGGPTAEGDLEAGPASLPPEQKKPSGRWQQWCSAFKWKKAG